MPRITKSLVDKEEPGEKVRFLWDDELKGFGVAIYPPSPRNPQGAKTYVIRYITREGVDRRMKLGRHGPLMPESARKLAKKEFADVADGRDPLEDRRQARLAPSVKALYERFERDHLSKKKPKTAKEAMRIFKKEILPEFGAKRVWRVSAQDVRRFHRAFKDRPTMGNRSLAWLSALMSYAEDEDERPRGSNPCTGITKYREEQRHRHLSLEELGRLGAALEKLGAESAEAAAQADAVRLAVLTGGRRSEILGLRREWIDTERRLIAYPDTKGGRVLRVLGPEALEILERRGGRGGVTLPPKTATTAQHSPEKLGNSMTSADSGKSTPKGAARDLPNESEYVFPSPRDPSKPRPDIRRFLASVLEEAEIKGASFHTFRHGKATAAAELGYSEFVIAGMLGHRRNTVTAGYTHLAVDGATRAADEAVQRKLWAALNRSEQAKVIPLTGRADGA